MIMPDKFPQSPINSGWSLSSVHRRSGGYCRYAAETGRRHPCHGAVAGSLGPLAIEITQLQYIDQVFDVLVAQVWQIRAKSWVTVEIPQLQLVSSWTGCCSPVVCNNRCPWSSQFIDGCERPCDHAATSGLVEGASDSVHRQSPWTFQFHRDGFAFSRVALLRVVLELSASFRALDDEEFFVIEGSCQLVSALSAGILRVWIDTCVNVISITTTTIFEGSG